jgi:hypothetical protein
MQAGTDLALSAAGHLPVQPIPTFHSRMLVPFLTAAIHQDQTVMSQIHLVRAYPAGRLFERWINSVGLAQAEGAGCAERERRYSRIRAQICEYQLSRAGEAGDAQVS